jgi:hypothetical protein
MDIKIIFEEIRRDISEIKTSQKVMERDVAHHIKRTELAEENIKLLRQDLKPVEDHISMMNGSLKLLGVLSILVAIVTGVSKLFF